VSPTKIASNFVGLTSFVFSSVRTLFSGDSNENLVLLQVKSCANMAINPMKPFSALEILGLKNSIEGTCLLCKNYPSELCEHLGRERSHRVNVWGTFK
jgi:hypothetical protein